VLQAAELAFNGRRRRYVGDFYEKAGGGQIMFT